MHGAIDLPRLLPPKRLDSLHPPTLLSRDVDGRSRQRRMSQVLLRNLNGHPSGNPMACMGVPHPMGTYVDEFGCDEELPACDEELPPTSFLGLKHVMKNSRRLMNNSRRRGDTPLQI